MTCIIRDELAGDETAIGRVIDAAFREQPHSNGSEPQIVAELRAAGELALSLVALEKAIVGHAAFSRVAVDGGFSGWFGLGPVAVDPACQRRGIGHSLIRKGLDRLRELGAAGCVVLGDPVYYARFGFVADPALAYPGPPAMYFQSMILAGPPARGIVRYSRAFG